MANTKISALPAATTADAADLTIVVTDIGAGALQDQKATVTQAATYSRALTGATTASAIVGSGSSLIINTSLAASDTRIAGVSVASLFQVSASLDKVGIATAVPTQKLDVTGTVNATLFAGSGASLTGLGATSTAFRTVATDPSPLVNGDVWYNSTSDTFKCALNAFATSTSFSTARAYHGFAGTPLAALVFAGKTAAASYTTSAEKWNGSSWSATGSSGTNRAQGGGCGTSSAALACGGYLNNSQDRSVPSSELYNGSSWSTTGALSTGRGQQGMMGVSTDALAFAGRDPSTGALSSSERFNGSTWSSATAFVSADEYVFSGTATSSSSGVTTGRYTSTSMYSYNGTTWTSASSRSNTALWGCGAGTATSAIGIGSGLSSESYNGSTWSSGPSTVASRDYLAGGGTSQSSVLITGGIVSSTYVSTTEILSSLAKTFTVA